MAVAGVVSAFVGGLIETIAKMAVSNVNSVAITDVQISYNSEAAVTAQRDMQVDVS